MLSLSEYYIYYITLYSVKQLKPESICYTRLFNRPAGLTVHWWSLHKLTVFVPVKNDEASWLTGRSASYTNQSIASLILCFRFLMRVRNEKDPHGEQNTQGLSSSFFVFVFWCASKTKRRRWRTEYPRPFFFCLCFRFLMPFKNEKDDDGEQNTLGLYNNIVDADTIPRSKPRRCGEWKAAPNPRRALDPYPCRSRSQTPGIFVMSLSPAATPPPPPPHNSWQSCWALKSPDLRLTKGTAHTSTQLPVLCTLARGEGMEGVELSTAGAEGGGPAGWKGNWKEQIFFPVCHTRR